MWRWVVQWPVVGLRQIPGWSPTRWTGERWPKDPFLDSQLLHGDAVLLLGQQGEWSWVAVPSQPRFRNGWQPYRGWVPTAALLATNAPLVGTVRSYTLPTFERPEGAHRSVIGRGSRLVGRQTAAGWMELATGGWVEKPEAGRQGPGELEAFARDWLGTPYLWGGTSAHVREWQPHRSGVDCSGLVWALWRLLGWVLPRDAHDQWRVATPLTHAGELQRGDLVFFSDQEPGSRIHHVMISLGGDRLIEASGSQGCVHESSLQQRCQLTPQTPNGSWTGRYRVWFGRVPHQWV